MTGFEFRGRHGTAILKGVVVAEEFQEAMQVVIDCYEDEHARVEDEMRSFAALRVWKRFLVGLRIKQRVDAYGLEDDEIQQGPRDNVGEISRDGQDEVAQAGGDDEDPDYVDDGGGGGGFFPD